jgi:hypothetical protein
MFDQPTLNKENTPPTHVPQIKKGARLNNLSTLQQQSRWTTKSQKEAMDPMERGEISLKVTSKHWHIPCAHQGRGCNNGGLDTRYITMWIVHYLAPINCTLFITMKVVKLTETKPTSF